MLTPDNLALIARTLGQRLSPYDTRAFTAIEMEALLNAARNQPTRTEEAFTANAKGAALASVAIEALRPFAKHWKSFKSKPMRGMGDDFHGLHMGTEWESEIKWSHFQAAADVLKLAEPETN